MEIPKLIRVEREAGRMRVLIDGVEIPPARRVVQVPVNGDRAPEVVVTFVADRVEVVNAIRASDPIEGGST